MRVKEYIQNEFLVLALTCYAACYAVAQFYEIFCYCWMFIVAVIPRFHLRPAGTIARSQIKYGLWYSGIV
ncbi:hypothetical protein B5X24_HaOG209962 [Helicoverpa armigera]|uniref:Uncharacterized protein n=1 Tax=Helicoverpa armigera TaxID=29058 RepID=A0A2W1BKB5_HELAM|nr:hypothetical protein B5X24_HaOG209962 [Helicoverpa armigera]